MTKKQELKKPDEFITTVDRIAELSRTHARQLWTAVALVLLVAVAVAGSIWLRLHQEERAAGLELQAAGYYHQPFSPETGEGKAVLPSREESLKKAIEVYKKVISDYPRTEAAALGQYYLGNSYLELGDHANAILAYDHFVKRYDRSAAMTALVYQRLGYAHLSAGDPTSALQSFESALERREARNRDQVLFEIAKLHEDQGRKEKAVQAYQMVVEEDPHSVLATESRVRLKALGVTETEPIPAPLR
jgi:tetratricopeptide (TPR) repeat protein